MTTNTELRDGPNPRGVSLSTAQIALIQRAVKFNIDTNYNWLGNQRTDHPKYQEVRQELRDLEDVRHYLMTYQQ